MLRLRGLLPVSFLMIGSMVGCNSITSTPPPLSSPFFTPTPDDSPRLSRLARELDMKALQCLDASTCEEVHFARALVSLFENKEAAQASFRRVIDDQPSGTLADSSRLWLRLIGEETPERTSTNAQQNPWRDITAQLIRDWMDRQLAEHMNDTQASERIALGDQSRRMVQELEKQLRERERRITVLRDQLDALKLIDEEKEARKRPLRVPATLLPLRENQR
jgi:hypothetical protein